MLRYQKIDFSEGNHVNETSASKECELCQYWFFKDISLKFEEHVYNKCINNGLFFKKIWQY